MSARRTVAIVGLASLGSCTDVTDTRRWSSMHWIDGSGEEVQVQVFAAPGFAAPLASTPFAGMSDGAQAAYVTAQAKFARSPNQLGEALSAPLQKPPGDSLGQPVTDRVQRNLVALMTRPTKDYSPGDRIMRAVVNIRPVNFTFGGYTVAATNRVMLDITSITRSTSQTGSVSINAAPPTSPVSGSAQAGFQHQVGTTTPLREPEEVLTVTPTPTCLTIVREGGYGVDLTGNTLVSVSTLAAGPPRNEACGVVGDVYNAENAGNQSVFILDPGLVFSSRGPAIRSGKTLGNLRAFPESPFYAQVTVNFILRRIETGGSSYEDGKQSVSLVRGYSTKCQVVLPAEALTPLLWVVHPGTRMTTVNVMVDGTETTLAFSDPQTAAAAAKWIEQSRPARIGSLPLRYDKSAVFGFAALRPLDTSNPCKTQKTLVAPD